MDRAVLRGKQQAYPYLQFIRESFKADVGWRGAPQIFVEECSTLYLLSPELNQNKMSREAGFQWNVCKNALAAEPKELSPNSVVPSAISHEIAVPF